ncbi:MAG: 1-deoxy-D-xylulose-5-phosphate reductoisomerase [Clostridiales bacterium]|nr:1-deoxy-D-xylulose-5-phosphate reductoisomerase [Clostridiales bacterium]
MKNVAVFGSTGSIGRQTLSVCANNTDKFSVYTIVLGSNYKESIEQIKQFSPKNVGVYDREAAEKIKSVFPGLNVVSGDEVWDLAADSRVDTVVNGVSGFSGVFPLIKAINAGKTVALANKESVVCAGEIFKNALASGGGRILPVDSEQSAIFQALSAGRRSDVKRLILTASGGAFRDLPIEKLADVTPEMAMKHPTWNMGRKITIDSATLFNKGLEVMEAAFLFDSDAEHISVLIHPQSIVHSMVEYNDGSVIAQLSVPDMRLAIQYAMTYPERNASPVEPLDFAKIAGLSFREPDFDRWPALPMAYTALKTGGSQPVAYNSGNEIAVDRFVRGELKFTDIPGCVEYAMNKIEMIRISDMDTLLYIDSEARRLASEYIPKG